MPEPNDPVNDADAGAAAVNDQQQEPADDQSAGQDQQSASDQGDDQGADQQQQGLQDRPQLNYDSEWKRKHDQLVDSIPQIVEETLKKVQVKPPEQTYTIEQLEQIAIAQPHLRPQVEAEKAKLLKAEIRQENEQTIRTIRQDEQNKVIRQQSEQFVVTHPKFKECFVHTPTGLQWNMANPLSQIMGQILQNPDIKNRPDAMAVAAEIAYGRYVLMGEPKATGQIQQQKRQIKQLQKKTLIEGSGQSGQQAGGDDFTKAREDLRRTGSRSDAQKAVGLHLKKMGLIPA